jgi:hypothetical protein
MLPKKYLSGTQKRKKKRKQEDQSIVMFYELYIYYKVIFIIY